MRTKSVKTEIEAKTAGKELCKIMGEGWETRVWENLGIWWEVRKDNVIVTEYFLEGNRKYMVTIEPNYAWWDSKTFYDDPVDGVKSELTWRYASVLEKMRFLAKAHTAIWGEPKE